MLWAVAGDKRGWVGLSRAGLIQICSLHLYIEPCAALLGVPGKMAREDCDPEHPHPWGRRRLLFSSKQAPVQEERIWAGIDVWGCTALSCAQRWSSVPRRRGFAAAKELFGRRCWL